METIQETVRKNLCVVCTKNTEEKTCMEIKERKNENSKSYKCLNFCKGIINHKLTEELEQEYKEVIVKHIFGSSTRQ